MATLEHAQERAYDSWARHYEAVDRDPAPFVRFYRSLIAGSPRALLDLGCGTGTILLALSRELTASTRLVGVDASNEMLEVARRHDGPAEWVLGDMRAPPVTGSFDFVMCCFNTLQLLLADRDLAQAFGSVRRLISADGIFAFDIYQPSMEWLSVPRTDRLARAVTDDGGRHLEIREDAEYDRSSRILTVDRRLVDADRPDDLPLARTRYGMRQYFPAEVVDLLGAAGLAVRERYGDLDRSPFTPASKRQVLVCCPI